jgi:predicted phage terminase large subunit-like protein
VSVDITGGKLGLSRIEADTLYSRLVLAARKDFTSFLALMFPQTATPSYYLEKVHLYVADLLQSMVSGRVSPRQAISLPPRHGKSRLVSVRFVAWLIGRFPGKHIALTGFSRGLLMQFVAEARDIMALPAYKRAFPGLAPRYGWERADGVWFNNGTSVIVRSCGSKLTGRHADFIIVDDVHAGRAEAESETQRKRVVQWFSADVSTRMTPNAKLLLVSTRWRPDDIIGYVTSEEYREAVQAAGQDHLQFGVTNMKAISDGINDPLGRSAGEPLSPKLNPLSYLEGQRATIMNYDWQSLYQGTPRSASSNQILEESIRYCNPDQVPKGIMQTRGWDLALTENQTADYTTGVRIGYDSVTDTIYIMDVFCERLAWARLRAAMVEVTLRDREQHGIYKIGVEGVGGFDAVYQEIKALLRGRVFVEKKNPPRGGKLLRAQPWLVKMEAGKVVIVRGPWNRDFVSELLAFPIGAHDDRVDGTSIAVETILQPAANLLIA